MSDVLVALSACLLAPLASLQPFFVTALHSTRYLTLCNSLSLTLDRYTDQNNWIKTFFSKYGLVGTRFTNKQTYKAPDPVMPSAVTGTVEKWMYASIYSDPTCGVGSGTLYR